MDNLKDNPIVLLVQEGMKMENENKIENAQKLFVQCWNMASNDYEKCIAAHFVARHQSNSEENLRWNMEALTRANKVSVDKVKSFYPSLFLCVGISYEDMGNAGEAKRYYDLAFQKIPDLTENSENENYNKGIKENILKRRDDILTKI